MTATQIVLTGLLLFTALGGFVDFQTGHIPNRLVALGALLGVVTHFAVHAGLLHEPQQPWTELLGGAAANIAIGVLGCAAVPLLLYRVSAMGGGDVKLLAAVGAWAGPILGLHVELYAFVLAALYAPARLAYQGELFKLLGNSAALIQNPFSPKARRKEVPPALLTELRFGPAVFAATALGGFGALEERMKAPRPTPPLSSTLRRDTRGVIFVEQLIAYLPVMFFFLAAWQLIELCAAHLIIKRAASAAARAAVVVLPDDPAFYEGVGKDQFAGKRKEDVQLAAAMILATSPHFSSDFSVEVPSGLHGAAPLTATVKAQFHCFAGWVSLVCGPGGARELTAKSTYAYQGADYGYDL